MGKLASFRPADGSFGALFRVIVSNGIWDAFIEAHDDVRAQSFFDFNRFFGAEEFFVAIELVFEFHPFFAEDAVFGQGKDLESSGIRKDRSVVIHEFMKPARFFDDIFAWAEVKMIGIG